MCWMYDLFAVVTVMGLCLKILMDFIDFSNFKSLEGTTIFYCPDFFTVFMLNFKHFQHNLTFKFQIYGMIMVNFKHVYHSLTFKFQIYGYCYCSSILFELTVKY